MIDKLQISLKERYPSLKPYQISRCVEKYLNGMMPLLVKSIVFSKKDNTDSEMFFLQEEARLACGRTRVDGEIKYIYSMMQEHSDTSIILVTYTGNNITKKSSKVVFNPIYKKEVMGKLKTMIEDGTKIDSTSLDEFELNSEYKIPVDRDSLDSYIRATRMSLKAANSEAYLEKLMRNLKIAEELMSRLKTDDGINYYSLEYWEEIDSGRMYGHGLSLQGLPKQVRDAALGPCHKYDLKAASYSILANLAKTLNPELKVAALTDYVKNRKQIRKRIAEDIGISEEWMKEIFTSIGFGASTADNSFSSVKQKIGAEKYAALMKNTEFKLIKKTFDDVTKFLVKYFPDDNFDDLGRTYKALDPKTGRMRTKAQKLAWIYQCLETQAMNTFGSFITENHKLLLIVHDCLYLKVPLSPGECQNIKYLLDQQFPGLSFDHEVILPIHANEDHGKREREILIEEMAHKQFIQHQEEIAKTYVPQNVTVSAGYERKKQVATPWGNIDEDQLDYNSLQETIHEEKYYRDSY